MTKAEILAFLEGQKYGVVATVAENGQPQGAVVGIAVDETGAVVFDTLRATRKAVNVLRDGRAALVVYEGERTLQIDGVVTEPSGAERERALAVYLAAFPDGKERLSWEGLTHFVIEATWARYSDFGAAGGPLVVELPHGFRDR